MRFKGAALSGSLADHFKMVGIFALLSFSLTWLECPVSLAQQTGSSGYYPTVTPGIQPTIPNYHPDFVPKFAADFWKGKTITPNMPSGTVLTGVLQDKLSSKSSRVGDVFAITLLDGYSDGGREMLPKGSKVVGAVTQVISGKRSINGQPGRLEISLQTLVLPDGRSTAIFAFVERNANAVLKQDPAKSQKGLPLSSYGQSLRNSATSLVSSVSRRAFGMQLYHPQRVGAELDMEPGEKLALHLNRPLDMAALLGQPIPTLAGVSGPQQTSPSASLPAAVPGLVEAEPQAKAPVSNQQAVPENGFGQSPEADNAQVRTMPEPF